MANPWQEAAESMKGTGVSNLGQSYAPTFTPQLVSNPYDAVDDISMSYDVSFPTQDMADRFDYGYGQMVGHMTNPDGSIDPWRYRDNDYYVNPDIFANVYGGGPNSPYNRGAKLLAEEYNYPSYTDNFDHVRSQQDILDIIAFNNALQAGEIDVDPMYMDEDMTYNIADPELYMTQEAQIADEPNAFVKTLMENYGRGNPYMQDLSGTYDNYFGETFDMDTGQVGLRDVVGDLKRYAEENADMIRDRQINRENPFYEDRIINMVPVPEEPTAMPPIPEDMYMDMFDDSNLGNYDLYHLMRNGYTLEEAQAILAEQGLA
tara:strand:- start:47 stop:1000 length:954 start_codon:yes stop_codon:yes gene_type:complete